MTTLTLAKLAEIEAAAAKATPVAWQLVTHKGLAETWIRLTPPIDDVEEYRPLYADCAPETVAALCRIARAAVDLLADAEALFSDLDNAVRAAGLLE